MSDRRAGDSDAAPLVDFEIDGIAMRAPSNLIIREVARYAADYAVNAEDRTRLEKEPIDIPVLCHKEDSEDEFKNVGLCRVCCVMEGSPREEYRRPKRFMAACCRTVEQDMKILTTSPDVNEARMTLIQLLLAEHPIGCRKHSRFRACELELLGERYGLLETTVDLSKADGEDGRYITKWRTEQAAKTDGSVVERSKGELFTPRAYVKPPDESNPSIQIDHSACILCDRCVRACTDVAHNDVIGREGKGYHTAIAFDDDKSMSKSSCVNCGWCMVACPTGAITYGFDNATAIRDKLPWANEDGGKNWLTAAEMKANSLFVDVSIEFLRRAEGFVRVKQFKAGEVICQQGEYGNTAFYIDGGRVRIFIDTNNGHIRTRNVGGVLKRVVSLLVKRDEPRAKPGERLRSFIPIDASVDLPYGTKTATMGPEMIFGEMACMNYQQRSATVVAMEDTIVIEMYRNVLDILRRQKGFARLMADNYRKYALANHLETTDLFAGMPPEFITSLRPRVRLERFEPGEVIIRQGESGDAVKSMYIVRMGEVKVEERFADGGQRVVAYLSKGATFGEIALLAPDGIRTATCTAINHCDVVAIDRTDFNELCEMFPEFLERVRDLADARIKQNREDAARLREQPLQTYLDQGLYHAQSLLVLDLERCTRCDECVTACAQAHNGVTRLMREGNRFDKFLVTTSCRSCRDPLCMIGCPVGAINRKGDKEIVIEDHCVGCSRCADQCPYGNIALHPDPEAKLSAEQLEKGRGTGFKATVCDLCTDQCLDEDEDPSCVYACPHDAAHRYSGRTFFDNVLKQNNGRENG